MCQQATRLDRVESDGGRVLQAFECFTPIGSADDLACSQGVLQHGQQKCVYGCCRCEKCSRSIRLTTTLPSWILP